MRITVLIDARNVLRSRWPNIPEREIVDRSAAWAARQGVEAVIVFDGRAPDGVADGCVVVGSGRESADDWIARAAAERAGGDGAYWLVTSDRELRARAGTRAARTIGGGTFASLIFE